MDLHVWLAQRGGIAHAHVALRSGFSRYRQRAAITDGTVERIRRDWLALVETAPDLRAAASAGGRVTCLSLANRLDLWHLPDDREHIAVARNSTHVAQPGQRIHWGRGPIMTNRYSLLDPIENALVRIASCQPFESALVVWDSALNKKLVTVEGLQRLPLRQPIAQAVRAASSRFSDSGLETLPVTRLAASGITVRQQVWLHGHRVDGLIGHLLVLQLDGYAHHSTPEQRRTDIAHDRTLALLGYTVLRFDYKQIIFEWPAVEREILVAIAQGLHR